MQDFRLLTNLRYFIVGFLFLKYFNAFQLKLGLKMFSEVLLDIVVFIW